MTQPGRPSRKQVLLRLDPAVHDALAAWAAAELRSTNAQIEYLLRRALSEAGRLPSGVRPIPRRGRPPKDAAPAPPPSGSAPSDPTASTPTASAPTDPGPGDRSNRG